jgi:hypothetical protein
MSHSDQCIHDLLDITRVALRRNERGAQHVCVHCEHDEAGRATCVACDAHWQVGVSLDSLRRGLLELLAAADHAVVSSMRLQRAAELGKLQRSCERCAEIALDALAMRDALLHGVSDVLAHAPVSELGHQLAEWHAQAARDAPEGEG